jgi:hypothetical protein
MPRSSLVRTTFKLVVLLAFGSVMPLEARGVQPDKRPDPQDALQKIARFSPDPCGPPYGREENWHSRDIEDKIFGSVANLIVEKLNAPPPSALSPHERAEAALQEFERLSTNANAEWPEEHRFHFEVLDLPPALVVKMGLRSHERFFVFGIPGEHEGKPNQLWQTLGSDDEFTEDEVPWSSLDLYALHRGPSGNVRFLARFIYGGCAGPLGIVYDAREWDGQGNYNLEKIIDQVGSLPLDDKVPGFPEVGELRTDGARITLPYCWFSAIDTWDNPSLCAVDTYDLSSDTMRFISRTYNRPDLVPIAKAIEYAEKRDYGALLGYCASERLARRLVRDAPPHAGAEDIRVTRTGSGTESVELGAFRFDLEQRDGRWLIVAFH